MLNSHLILDLGHFRQGVRQLLGQGGEPLSSPCTIRTLEGGQTEFILGQPWRNHRAHPLHQPGLMMVLDSPAVLAEWLPENRDSTRETVMGIVAISRDHPGKIQIALRGGLNQATWIGSQMIRWAPSTEPSSSPAGETTSRVDGAMGPGLTAKVRALRVFLVGAGGGGSELARAFTSLGIAKLAVCDPDRVEAVNLPNLIAGCPSDATKKSHKVAVLLKDLGRHWPDTIFQGLRHRVQDPECVHYLNTRRFDLIATFVDNHAANQAASVIAKRSHTPLLVVNTHISFSTAGQRTMRADHRLFEAGRGCPFCTPKLGPEEQKEAWYEMRRPNHAWKKGPKRPWNATRAGSLLILNDLASSLAVDLVLRYLAGTIPTSHWIRMTWIEGQLPSHEETSITPAGDCWQCSHRE